MTEDELLARLDAEADRRTERVRAMLMEAGRPDLVQGLDAKLREIRLGVDGARGTWHALSEPQRRTLTNMARHSGGAWRDPRNENRFHHRVEMNCLVAYRAATIRNLMARGLLDWGADRRVVITERGRFVLKHGAPSAKAVSG